MDGCETAGPGGPADARLEALCAASDAWTGTDAAAAESEGWNVFAYEGRGLVVGAVVGGGAFATDGDAVDHVRRGAADGSRTHGRALAIHDAQHAMIGLNPENEGLDVQVVPREALDEDRTTGFPEPWLVVFADGRVDGHRDEDAACAQQRRWRDVNGLDPRTGERRAADDVDGARP